MFGFGAVFLQTHRRFVDNPASEAVEVDVCRLQVAVSEHLGNNLAWHIVFLQSHRHRMTAYISSNLVTPTSRESAAYVKT